MAMQPCGFFIGRTAKSYIRYFLCLRRILEEQ